MEKTIMEKECAICGKFFSTTNKLRKYCDDCRDNLEHAMKKYTQGLKMSKKNYIKDPEIVEYTCLICQRKFTTIPKLLFCIGDKKTETEYVFCSKFHMDSYFRRNRTCKNCNTSLDGNLFYDPDKSETEFCSPKCKKEYDRRNGILKPCAYCGKEYYGDNKYFCSSACHLEAVRNGWRSPLLNEKNVKQLAEEENDPIIVRRINCAGCGRVIAIKDKASKLLNINPFSCFCSENCRNKGKKKPVRIKTSKAVKTEKPVSKKTESQICSSCKTSYKDCERMQSDFRIIPKGARFNGQGILVSCPKFS